MHYLMLVTLTMLPGETSPEARVRIYTQLAGDSSFCGDGGRFGITLGDWFVIGGRWSGMLRETVMGNAYRDKLAATFSEFTASYYSKDRVKERAGNSMPYGGNSEALARRPSTAMPIGKSATTMTPCR